MTSKINETRKKLSKQEARMNYHLMLFGDHLAEKLGYKDLDGLEAIQYFLMIKHDWLPSHVKSMSYDDLRFSISQEIAEWRVPQ